MFRVVVKSVESYSPQVNTGSAIGVKWGRARSSSGAWVWLENGGVSGMFLVRLGGWKDGDNCCKGAGISLVDKRWDNSISGTMQPGSLYSNFEQRSQRNMCACLTGIPRLSCSAWAENIANTWLPYTNIWENFKGHNFNSKAWIKIPKGQIPSFNPFCVPM